MTEGNAARDTFGVFGTTAVLLVSAPDAVEAARAILDTELAAVDLACSRFRADSELSVLNSAGGATIEVSELFAQLLGVALRAARLTDGDVDPTCGQALVSIGYDRDFTQLRATARQRPPLASEPGTAGPAGHATTGPAGHATTGPAGHATTGPGQAATGPARQSRQCGPVPGWRKVQLDRERLRVRLDGGAQLDLGATAKAWAADRCAEQAAGKLDCGVLVSLGGDIAVAGQPPADGWRVRVTDDHAAQPDVAGQTVTIRSGGLATSSTTVRTWTAGGTTVHHIINPATGQPVRSCWRTVSVAAGSCVDANTASTAAIIRGAAALPWLHETGLPARLVRTDGSVETIAGWPRGSEPTEAG
jgi:thiamine biosynthesis lipoprotein